MQLVTVGSKYQIVIPKEIRKKVKGINPGAKVAVSAGNQAVTIKPAENNWVERTYGMMSEVWKDIDPAKEIEKMRDEWEEKVQEIERQSR